MFFGCVHVNDSEETVKQLNRALSEWVDSVPEHRMCSFFTTPVKTNLISLYSQMVPSIR